MGSGSVLKLKGDLLIKKNKECSQYFGEWWGFLTIELIKDHEGLCEKMVRQ